MKTLVTLLISIAMFGCLAQPPPRVYTVTVNTNKVLVTPTGFFATNSTLVWNAISNRIDPVPFRASTNNNLYLTVQSGVLVDAVGNKITYGGSTELCLASKTNYIALDINSLEVGVYPRFHDTGLILLAVARCDGTKITNVYQPEIRLPRSRIEKFKAKLMAGQKVTVVGIGDSIMGYTAGEASWFDMVFTNTTSAYGYNLPYVTNVTAASYAAGGQDPRYGLAVLGRHWISAKIPEVFSSGLVSIAFDYGPYYSQTLVTGDYEEDHMSGQRPAAESPVIASAPDLAVVCFYNHTTDQTAYIESIVRKLKKAGSDVILYSAGPRDDAVDTYESDGPDLVRIADAYGCEFVDMWARQRAEIDYSVPILADHVHPNLAGIELWANATRSVINSHSQESERPPVPVVRVVKSTSTARAARFPEQMDLMAWPGHADVAAGTTAITTTSANLALLYGGKATTNGVYTLAAGDTLAFSHFNALAWDVLIEGNSGFTANILASGQTNKTVSYSAGGLAPHILTCLSMDELTSASGNVFGDPGLLDNATYGFQVASGTAKVIAFVIHSLERRELPFELMSFRETWATETARAGIPSSRYSDTNGASVTIPFYGRGIGLLLQGSTAAGKVDISIDGVQTHSALDLYYNGSFCAPVFLFPYGAGTDMQKSPANHAVTIKLNGANGSVTAPTNTYRRITLGRAYVYD
jgi:hypothetical protein